MKNEMTLVIDTGERKPRRVPPVGLMADYKTADAVLREVCSRRAPGSPPVFAYWGRLGGDKARGMCRDIIGRVIEVYNLS